MFAAILVLSLSAGPSWGGAFDGVTQAAKTPDEQCEETVEFTAMPVPDSVSDELRAETPALRTETPKDFLDRVIELRDLSKLAFEPQKVTLRGGNPPSCPYCPAAKARFPKGGHPLIEIEWTGGEIPGSKFYPCAEDPVTGYIFWKRSLDSWDELVKSVNTVRKMTGNPPLGHTTKSMPFGTLRGVRPYFETAIAILDRFGKRGEFRLENDPFSYSQKWFAFNVPAKVRLAYAIEGDVVRFTASPKVSVGAFGLARDVSAVAVNRATWSLTIEVDSFPDGKFNIE